MAKPTIVTRAGKGSALTWTEGDANLTNLQDATITLKAGTGGTDVVSDLNGTVTLVAGTNVTLTGDNTAKTVTIAASGGGSTANFTFTTDTITSTGAISLVPNSANNVIIDGLTWPATDGTSNQVLKTDGAGNLTWTTISSGITSISQDTNPVLGAALNTSGYNLYTTNNANIGLAPAGTGKVVLSGMSFPNADGTNGQLLTTNGTGTLSWTTVSSGATNLDGLNDVVITAAAANEFLVHNGTNWVDRSAPSANAALNGFTSSATANSTTTLTNTSTVYQLFTGVNSSQTVALPSTATLSTGWSFHIVNNCTGAGALAVVTSTGVSLATVPAGVTVMVTCISIADNTAASWELGFTDFTSVTGTGSVVLAAGPTISGTLTSSGRLSLVDLKETVYSLAYGATITPNVANGTVQVVTLTGNVTFSAFTSPTAGQSLTLIVKQDATGSRTLTSTMKFAGGTKTLSTAANSVDIISVFYDGTNYWASLGKDFK